MPLVVVMIGMKSSGSMNSIITSSFFFLVLLCCLSDNSVSSSAILEVASTSSSQPSIIANIDDAPTTNTSTTTYSNTILQQSTSVQDAYVKASPLSVAAVCNDGIVMISLHYNVEIEDEEESTSSSAANDEEDNTELASEKAQEILDIISNDDTAYTALVEKKSTDYQQQKQQQVTSSNVFRDLPLSTRGPLRIEPIYEISTSSSGSGEPPPMALLTAGWRTDGITLCDAARELISEEVRLYCLPTLVGISNDEEKDTSIEDYGQDSKLIENTHSNLGVVVKKDGTVDDTTNPTQSKQSQPSQPYYGRRIAEGLSYYLAKCSFSEGIRSLSTIGLLACGTNTATTKGSDGSLYLVDATGIHSVRAHAIGNGSSNIHKRIVYVDFNTIDCQEGLRVLLRLIAEEGGLISKTGSSEKENVQEGKLLQEVKKSSIMAKPAFLTKRKNKKKNENKVESPSSEQSSWNIPSNTAVELGVIKSGDQRMRRIRLSSLFS